MAKLTKTEETNKWLQHQAWRSSIALRQLVQAKKQRCTDYDDRIRAVRLFSEQLYVRAADTQQSELFSPGELLSGELEKLLAAPLHGLD